jgi:hypothetical protein
MKENTFTPPTTPVYLTVTIILALSFFIPIVNIFSGLGLILWLLGWAYSDLKGFLSTLWRTLLSATLFYSLVLLRGPSGDSSYQMGVIAAVAFSACSLSWSLIKAHLEKRNAS